MEGRIKTYDPKKVVVGLGNHLANGWADDSFISIEASGDGVTKKVGCDGEIARSITPDDTYTLKMSFLQTSMTNQWLQNMHNYDRNTGEGMFPVLIKDMRGGTIFSAAAAWITKSTSRSFGKESNNLEWEIHTGAGILNEELY